MATANLVQKRARMSLQEIIRFQIANYCYFRNIGLSDSDLDCLTLLGMNGESELTEFCDNVADLRHTEKMKNWKATEINQHPPEPSSQTVRNIITKAEKSGLIVKIGKGRKKITLNPDLKIQTNGNIVIDLKFAYVNS